MYEEPMEIDDYRDEPMGIDEPVNNDDDVIKKKLMERFAKEMAKMINKLVVESCLGCRFRDRNKHIGIRMKNEEKVQRFSDEALNRISEVDNFKNCIHNLSKPPMNNLRLLKYLCKTIFKDELIRQMIVKWII